MSWITDAACNGLDVNVFFPPFGDMKAMNFALSICSNCKVKNECLENNLWESDGVWGGTSAKQRKIIRINKKDKMRPCLRCKKLFKPSNPSVRMCGDICRIAARNETYAKSKIKNT